MLDKEISEGHNKGEGIPQQNEGLLNLVEDAYYYLYEEDTAQWAIGEVARQINHKEYLTVQDWRVDFLIDPGRNIRKFTAKEERYLELIQEEVAKYVLRVSASDNQENQDRFRFFFGVPLESEEEKEVRYSSTRLFFASRIVSFLARQGIDNNQLKEKLFRDVCIDYAIEQVFKNDDIEKYLREVSDMVRYFTESEFFEVEEYKSVFRDFIYKSMNHLYTNFDTKKLTIKDSELHKNIDDILHREWIWDGSIEESFIEDEQLQESLLKVDTAIKGVVTKRFKESSLDIFNDCINGFSTKIYERRLENIHLIMEDIFVSLKDLEESNAQEEYELLFEKYQRLSDYYCDEYSYILQEVISEITGITGVYNKKALLPEIQDMLLEIEWGSSMTKVLNKYSNIKYLLKLNGTSDISPL